MDVPTMISLLQFRLTSTSFRYSNKSYQPLDGLAMGSPVSSIVADIFMDDFDEKSITKETSVTPRLWKRFVDDILAVVRIDKSHKLLEHLHRQHPRVRFTIEKEGKGVLPFMDVCFSCDERGSLHREMFQKPTHTNRYIQFSSHHPESVKSGVIECLVDRAMIVSREKRYSSKNSTISRMPWLRTGIRRFLSRRPKTRR